jgi:hypothetical protein
MDLPSHPESSEPGSEPPPRPGRAGTVVVAALLVLVALIVILHLTGIVGPGAH